MYKVSFGEWNIGKELNFQNLEEATACYNRVKEYAIWAKLEKLEIRFLKANKVTVLDKFYME